MVKIGYTSGVFDLFHVGHLNLLEKAKANCDYLIVAVCGDELSYKLKKKYPVINFDDRLRIVKSLKCVDKVVAKKVDDDVLMAIGNEAKIVFKGSDWEKSPKWVAYEKRFSALRIKVKYFPYTTNVSSSKLRGLL